MAPGRDLPALVRWAREAEDAGFDSVMISEHVVLGPSAARTGSWPNPREYALPGNQDPATPWPSSLVLLSAIAAVTERIRLVAGAVIAPLAAPAADRPRAWLARPASATAGWSCSRRCPGWRRSTPRSACRSARAATCSTSTSQAWAVLWRDTPASFAGEHYSFRDVYFEPKAFRPGGPALWLGGAGMHRRMMARIVRYGDGFNPLGRPRPTRCGAWMRRCGRQAVIRAGWNSSAEPGPCSPATTAWPILARPWR